MNIARRVLSPVISMLLAVVMSGICLPSAFSQGEEEALVQEANRLTGEILDLRTRRKAALSRMDELRFELQSVQGKLALVQAEMGSLEEQIDICRGAYAQALRTLYMQGRASELEVILDSSELDDLWRNIDYLDRFTDSLRDAHHKLKVALEEKAVTERELREYMEKRDRLLESLDLASIDSRISALEDRLSQINARLREIRNGRAQARNGAPISPAPAPGETPVPGKLLERVPDMPPLSCFERTGIVYSGYTTSYGADFHGRPTASGVVYNMYDFTCAHRTLPFGTWLLVTFRGKQVIVQVNDRGPFVPGRVLDLSWRAAQTIGLDGVQWTEFEVLVPRG